VLFAETQRFRQWWLHLVVLFPVVVAWTAFWRQILRGQSFGRDPASDTGVWILFLGAGVLLPAVFLAVRLRTEVRPGEVVVRFPPFRPRRVDLDEVLDVRVVEYRPLVDYGGWGYRRTLKGDVAFTLAGHRGVRLGLAEGRHLLVGSQRPEEFATAVAAARTGG
jgi:hypothetical protein